MDDLTRRHVELLLSDRPGRLTAAEWLSDERSPEALEPFLQIVADENEFEELRVVAATGLGRIGGKEAVPALLEIVTGDGPMPLKEASITALGEIGPDAKEAIDPLVGILFDESGIHKLELAPTTTYRDHHVGARWRAAEALGRIGDVRALGPLTYMALKAENSAIRDSAIDSLKYLGWRR